MAVIYDPNKINIPPPSLGTLPLPNRPPVMFLLSASSLFAPIMCSEEASLNYVFGSEIIYTINGIWVSVWEVCLFFWWGKEEKNVQMASEY